MNKRLNVKNMVIVLVALVLIHFVVGLFVSPKFGELLVKNINQNSQAKVSLERVNFWPLTLSVSLTNLKIFDPQDTDKKIAEIKQSSVYLSLLGLLSKRLVLSDIKFKGANINLEGEPDGTFNIQRLAQPKSPEKSAAPSTGVPKGVTQKKDWFTKGYDLLKKRFSAGAIKKEKAKQAEAKKITKSVAVLPRGRSVHFKSKDSYLFEIKKFNIVDSNLNLKNHDGRAVQVENVRVALNNAAFDPELGLRLGKANIEGQIKNAGVAAGSLKFLYKSNLSRDMQKAQFNFILHDVNLDAMRFFYEDSLPVAIVKGVLDLTSETALDNGNINSKNKLILKDHELQPKGLAGPTDVFMPLPLLCENLNNTNPMRLEFTITGAVDKPEFKGLMQSLGDLVKPNLKNVGQTIKSAVSKDGISGILGAVSGKKEDPQQDASSGANKEKSSTQNAISSLGSIFKKN